ncbi:MAG TPA: NAD(P)H-dependent oxidoreductase [Flavitalea sp.]|nr:NAD(P)H-dependent oxidoreductase [Flavitalea sp.]
MNTSVHFVGLSGSLRKGSYNTALLNAITGLLPQDTTMEIASVADIPLYNADLDLPAASARPPIVQAFRDQLAKADAFVIVSPEYNYSIPGGLKNAIDWASRGEDSPMLQKAVAVMGATPGMWGTIRMQMAFQPVFLFLNMKPVLKPEVLIAQAKNKFNEQGQLIDITSIDLVRKKLEALRNLVVNEKKLNL